ncbi:tRNA (adenosine(37)-N6)-dimethylallyltransferase MiaA [Fodinibacter luteus]|uniref:tRNA dimethylallyltransferase n=1 Tax=Fodinibacter luteus TaxID=552064 RepID=A0ABP8KBW9_9MICO
MSTDGGPTVVAVVGPTATGKSELGLRLAEELGGEVVGADASQLYRGMDIGTAKLAPDARRGIPHHQIDVLEVTEEASVAAYQRHARADLADIRSRGRHPVVVGGSGLYVRALLDRLDIPPTDPAVRRRIEEHADEVGTDVVHAELVDRDPLAAAALEPGNRRRIVRALEVIELTGRPFSATLPRREFVHPTLVLGLLPLREVLDRRIAQRVERMWAQGLLDEVRTLERHGIRSGRTASTAIGYAQALAHLDGLLDEAAAREQTVTASRRLARRQESWFRPDPRVTWVDPTDPDAVDAAVAGVLAAVRRGVGDNGRHG